MVLDFTALEASHIIAATKYFEIIMCKCYHIVFISLLECCECQPNTFLYWCKHSQLSLIHFITYRISTTSERTSSLQLHEGAGLLAHVVAIMTILMLLILILQNDLSFIMLLLHILCKSSPTGKCLLIRLKTFFVFLWS